MDSFRKPLLPPYCIPDTVLSTGEKAMMIKELDVSLQGLTFY